MSKTILANTIAAVLLLLAGGVFAQPKPPAAGPPPNPAAAAPSKPAEVPPVSSVPQSTTAVFGDWALQCRHLDGTPANAVNCEVNQTLQVQGQGPIAQIAIGRPPVAEGAAKEGLRLVVVLPNNVTFGASVQMSVDDKDKPVDLAYRRCLPSGCYADAEIKDEYLGRWRAQSERGRLNFRDGGNRPVTLPFSFRGLSQAMDALAKS